MNRSSHTVRLRVSSHCDLDCLLCTRSSAPELSHAELISKIESMAKSHNGVLHLFGCDPLCRDDLEGLVRHAKEQGFARVGVLTNGVRFADPDVVRGLDSAGLSEVVLPLYSTDSRVHDAITRQKGSFERFIEGLSALKESSIDLRLQVRLLSAKAQQPEDLVRLISKLTDRIRAVEVIVPNVIPTWRIGKQLAPPAISKLRPILDEFLTGLSGAGIPAKILPRQGIPFCAVGPAHQTTEVFAFHPNKKVRKERDFSLDSDCASCAMEPFCSGVHSWYAQHHGMRGIEPLQEKIVEPSSKTSLKDHFRDPLVRARAASVRLKVIRPTIKCNQLCPFCSANETSENSFRTERKTKKKIIRWYRLGARHLSFSGGEPTLVNALPQYIRTAKQLGYEKIEIVTNGTRANREEYAKTLVEAGLDIAFLSLHAANEPLSAQCTGREGDWEKTVQAIHNFQNLEIRTEINHVISRINHDQIEDFVRWFHGEFGAKTAISFAFLSPLYRASRELDLMPTYSEVMPSLRSAMDFLYSAGHVFVVLARAGIPWCQLRGGYMQFSDLPQIANEARSEDDYKKSKAPQCDDCAIKDVCPGVFKEYLDLNGPDEFVPLTESEVEVSLSRPKNPWFGVVDGEREYLTRISHDTVDWEQMSLSWTQALEAVELDQLEQARTFSWDALGFEVDDGDLTPLGDADSQAPAAPVSLIDARLSALGVIDIEELRYRSKGSDVLHYRVPQGELETIQERFSGDSVRVVTQTRTKLRDEDEGKGVAHVIVGRVQESVDRLATIYKEGDPEAQGMEVAKILGYPTCCAAAYVSMSDRASAAECIYAAAKREYSTVEPLLNVGAVRLTPFLPCRFDCADARSYATQSLSLLFDQDDDLQKREEIRKEMGRPTIVFDQYRSIVFEGHVVGNTIRFTKASLVSRATTRSSDERVWGESLGALLARSHKLELNKDQWNFVTAQGVVSVDRNKRAPGVLLPFRADER